MSIENIEKQVLELEDMMKEMNSLVHSQQTGVDDIEEWITISKDTAIQGNQDLTSAQEYNERVQTTYALSALVAVLFFLSRYS